MILQNPVLRVWHFLATATLFYTSYPPGLDTLGTEYGRYRDQWTSVMCTMNCGL